MSIDAGNDEESSASYLLQPSEYSKYEEGGILRPVAEGFTVNVHSSWPADGEDRIGYTQIIRLVECAREKHWQDFSLEVAQRSSLSGIDSTVVEFSSRFVAPMKVRRVYVFSWRIVEANARGYLLEVSVVDDQTKMLTVSCLIKSRYLRSSDGLPVDVIPLL